MHVRFFRQFGAMIVGCAGLLLSLGAFAQAAPTATNLPVRTSRIEIYGAYSYLHPVEADINKFYSQPINASTLAGANFFFNRYLGVQAEGSTSPSSASDCAATLQGGPVLRFQMRRVVPFLHATAGGAKLGGPVFQPCTWGWGITGGLGFDYVLPAFHERIAIRPVQADYEFNHVDYGPLVLPGGFAGGLMKMNAYRLSAGVVLRFGNLTPPPPMGMSCSVIPGDIFAGEPITGTAQSINTDPHKKTTYTWHVSGGTLSGKGDTVQIDTTGLAPGNYTLSGHMEQGKQPAQQADCNAHFAIKAILLPPTITCSASPSSVHPGDIATITTKAGSPQNSVLTYSYTATEGTVTGNGATATLNTAGIPSGTITVTCNVVDDLGKSASATTSVQVLPAVIQALPQPQPLCTIAFDRDHRRPARVDNESTGCLDDIALTLQRQSDAHLVIVGSRLPDESPDIAAQRTVNTKLYLTKEKGIDPSRIQLRSGDTSGRSVYQTLVPEGATFSQSGTAVIDESTVKTSGPAYGVSKKPAAKRKK